MTNAAPASLRQAGPADAREPAMADEAPAPPLQSDLARAKASPVTAEPPDVLLQVEGLTKTFGGVVALDALSFSVNSGEVAGLIGPNGSGKTTFFNVTTGIYKPDAGSIVFKGKNLAGASPQAIHRAGIARTFQRSRLSLPLSIFDNIMIGAHTRRFNGLVFNLVCRGAFKHEFERMVEVARSLLKVFEPELADRLFEPVMGLPMIDRRRIEICRALISEPSLLFLDEPSAGMTHEETHALMDNILRVRAMHSSLAIVIVEHQMGVIERITDRCAVLNFGRKIAEGTYREVASNAEVQEAYLGAGL
jgi:branched-chain amino acid transport system ATP-binding protein